MMIELFTSATPNGHKISIALEELGLMYTVNELNLGANEQKKNSYLKLNPNGKIPAIIDHDNNDFVVFESGAILIYLAEKTGKLLPQNEYDRSITIQWLMFQMGGVGPMLGQAHHFRQYAPEKLPYAIERYTNEAQRLYKVVNERLEQHEFLADEYSIADMATFPWYGGLVMGKLYEAGEFLDVASYANVVRWAAEIQERPAVARGQRVNKAWGPEELQVLERHGAADLD